MATKSGRIVSLSDLSSVHMKGRETGTIVTQSNCNLVTCSMKVQTSDFSAEHALSLLCNSLLGVVEEILVGMHARVYPLPQ